MKLIDYIKLNIIFLLRDTFFTKYIEGYEYYVENVKNNSALDILLKSASRQILNNKGLTIEDPISDQYELGIITLLNILKINYIKTGSNYTCFKDSYIIDTCKIYTKETRLLNHRVWIPVDDKNNIISKFRTFEVWGNNFKLKEVNVVASRPSMGVTSFLIQLAADLSRSEKVFYFVNKHNEVRLKSMITQYKQSFSNTNITSLRIINCILGSEDLKNTISKLYKCILFIDDFDLYKKYLTIEYLNNIVKTNKLLIFIGSSLKRTVESKRSSIPSTNDLKFTKENISKFKKIILLRRPYYYDLKANPRIILVYVIQNNHKKVLQLKLAKSGFQRIE
jgi:hypothetical protein